MTEDKICSKCNQPGKSFYKCSKPTGFGHPWCKDCQRVWYYNMKLDVFLHYSRGRGDFPSCACCGESEPTFLTLDHINNDGNKHRKQVGGRGRSTGLGQMLRWIKKSGYPPLFQVLCWNCNCGRYSNGGLCPHLSRLHGL